MGLFERFLTLWVGLAILAGVVLGSFFPSIFAATAALEVAHVNLPVAVLIWVMIYPMMVQIDFSALRKVREKPQGLVLTCIVNWLIKPFTMALFGWVFFRLVFASFVTTEVASEYIAGMILLGAAPCTAMVFVWSQLMKGDPNYTLVQVAVNDLIMIFAFAPITAFLLGVSNIEVPWATLLLSVGLYVVLPLLAGVMTRKLLDAKHHQKRLGALIQALKPWSVAGLLGTVVLLFGFQASVILQKPLAIVLIAVPILLQCYLVFGITWIGAGLLRLPKSIAGPACLIGASNFFELAVAVAIALFGLDSGAALATVVGVLVEVPVMLSLVWVVNHSRRFAD